MGRKPLGDGPMSAAERQARRREQFRRMQDALERIARARTAKEARKIAAGALADDPTPLARTPGAP